MGPQKSLARLYFNLQSRGSGGLLTWNGPMEEPFHLTTSNFQVSCVAPAAVGGGVLFGWIPIQSVGSEVAIVQYLWSGTSRQAKHGADGQHGYGLAEESCRVSPV